MPKQTAGIFHTEGSSLDSFPTLSLWPGWNSFQESFQEDLVNVPSAKVYFSPFCLQDELQWLAIWELEESAPTLFLNQQKDWDQSTFQQQTIYFAEDGNAVCAMDNLVFYATMPILIEDALRALQNPYDLSQDAVANQEDAWLFIPSNLKEAGQSCWNIPVLQNMFSHLPKGIWAGSVEVDSTVLWQGKQVSETVDSNQMQNFPFWALLPVDLVWATFSGKANHPGRLFWQEPIAQLPWGDWFMQGSLESKPSGGNDLFAAIQLREDLDSLTLPGLPDQLLAPDYPMVLVHRVEALEDRPAYWVFQLEDVLFLVPSREQAYTLIARFINNQTLELNGGKYQQALSGNNPLQFLYYRSALDAGWYQSIWQKEVDLSLQGLAWRGTYFFGQTTDLNWHLVQQEDRKGVPPKTDRTLYLSDSIRGEWSELSINGTTYLAAQTARQELLLYQNNLQLAWSRRFNAPLVGPPQVLQGEGEQLLLMGTSSEIFLFQEDGSLLSGYPLQRNDVEALALNLGYVGTYWLQTRTEIQTVEIRKDPLRPEWKSPESIDSLSYAISHYQTKDQDLITGITAGKNLFAWDLKGQPLFDSIPLETPAIAAPAFQEHPLSTRLITPMQDGRVKITSLSGAGFNLRMEVKGPLEHWAVGDLGGDERLEYIGSSGNELVAMGYQGKDWITLFSWQCPGRIDEIRTHQLPAGTLLSVLDRKSERIWLLNANGAVLEGFPVAGKVIPLIQEHPNQRGYRILTHLDKTVVSYQWGGF